MSNVFLYAVTVLAWGTTWLAIEFQLGSVAPEISLFYRYALAAILMFGWCFMRRLHLRFPPRAHILFVLFGLLLFGINYILAYRAQLYISSALNAIVFSAMLWLNIFNMRVFFRMKSDVYVVGGAVLGVAGILMIFLPQVTAISLDDQTLFGAMLSLIGAVTASFGNVAAQKAKLDALPVVQCNAWGMFYSAVLLAAYALVLDIPFNFEYTASYVVSLLYLSVVGTIVAFSAYLTLLGRIGANRSAYVVVMFPVVALILSILFEGLSLDITIALGIALVLAGNVLILRHQGSA